MVGWWALSLALILAGAVLVLTGLASFGYSHEESVAAVLVGFVLSAGALRVAHTLPPDSSPW